MRKSTTALILMLGIAATGMASASEIYKWTDEDGNVHYGDRPSADSAEQVAIVSRPTDNERIQDEAEARRLREAEEAERRAAEPPGPTPEEQRAEAAARAEKCASYRERLQKFVTSRRLYHEDASGERVYLDEQQMQEARARVQGQVEEYCSP